MSGKRQTEEQIIAILKEPTFLGVAGQVCGV